MSAAPSPSHAAAASAPHRFESARALRDFVGRPARTSAPTPIDQAMIDAFGKLTNDEQWIHVDPVRAAREAPFKTTIAHGFLTLSLLSGWHADCFDYADAKTLVNYGFDKIRFTAPVPSGARVSAAFVLARATALNDEDTRCLWQVEVRVEGAERPALVAEWQIQVRF